MADPDKLTVDDFATLLQKQQDNHYGIMQNLDPPAEAQTDHLQAKKSASLSDFIDMVAMITSKAMKKQHVVFEPDEGARPRMDQEVPLTEPHIYYDVISRVPKKELKPRERQEIYEKTDDKTCDRPGRVFGQRFECVVQFNIMAADYKQADKVMKIFEELIFNYVSYFKQNGVAEILFQKQMTDRNLDAYRQSLSVRSLQYYVEIEQLHAVFDEADIVGIITDEK